MQIEALEIDDHVRAKLQQKHGVTWQEAQEVCFEDPYIRRGRAGTYLIFGQTSSGRYLVVVLIPDASDGATWRVLTARDMTETERKAYRSR